MSSSIPKKNHRRGSVMIMVVALLVLLAIMGTAWIATVRLDRGSSQANITNTQGDLQMAAVMELAKSAVTSGLFDNSTTPPTYRPINPAVYSHFDSPWSTTNDAWLADRVPMYNTAAATYYWSRISGPLMNGQFEDPGTGATPANSRRAAQAGKVGLVPTFVTINNINYPALDYDFLALAGSHTLLAVDTDGDGVADALPFRLWPGQVDGLDWYAAVRIVDNAGAVNASVAATPFLTPPAGSDYYTTFRTFPTGIDLEGVLLDPVANTDFVDSVTYRTNGIALNGTVLNSTQIAAIDDGKAARTDMWFVSPFDALWHQLGRRLDNPGYLWDTAAVRTRRFPSTDTLSLASRFVLPRPGQQSALEARMPNGLYSSVPRNPYPLYYSPPLSPPRTQADVWGDDNFSWQNPASTTSVFNRRTILVAGNPVSNAIQVPWFNPLGVPTTQMLSYNLTPYAPAWDGTANYLIGDLVVRGGLVYGCQTNKNNKDPSTAGTFWLRYPVYRGDYDPALQYAQGDVVGVGGFDYVCSALTPAVPAGNPAAYGTLTNPWEPIRRVSHPVKTCLNTASFQELYRAFWSVMSSETGHLNETPFGSDPGSTSKAYDVADNPAHMFRSTLRDPRKPTGVPGVRMDGRNMMMLRSAIAALNTMSLRSGSADIMSRTIRLSAWVGATAPTATSTDVDVTIFSSKPQPFITEVYASTDTVCTWTTGGTANPGGYVAIELYNPSDIPINIDARWRIAIVNRAAGYPNLVMTTIPLTAQILNKGQFLVLQSGTNRSSIVGAPGTVCTVAGLEQAIAGGGHEIVLLRPRDTAVGGVVGTKNLPYNMYNEANPDELVPVDSFDFTGIPAPQARPVTPAWSVSCTAWHYVRDTTNAWKCVYPGRYDGANAANRHEMDQAATWTWTEADVDLTLDKEAGAEGWGKIPTHKGINLGQRDPTATYTNNFLPIQICGAGWPGPWPVTNASAIRNQFPFGGFARVGDILQVPFMGAYTVRQATGAAAGAFMEINSLPMDCSFADDTDSANDANESIGRFCPIVDAAGVVDLSTSNTNWRYHWAMRIFDYFTVLAPHDDFLPNTNPDTYPITPTTPVLPGAVSNADMITTDQRREDSVGVEGLININSAPARVLAAIPWFGPDDVAGGTAAAARAENVNMAIAIETYRATNGPFKTIFDLYNVPRFRTNAMNLITGTEPLDKQGDLALSLGRTDGVRGDFKERYLFLNRVSNLITTRSDSFTAYLVVQGWRNAGTSNAKLAVQRRFIAIFDRSGVNANNKTLRIMTCPND